MVEKIGAFISTVKSDWVVLENELIKKILFDFENNVNTKEIEFNKENKIEGIKNKFGVYFFEIKPKKNFDLADFEKNWKINIDEIPKYCPNLIKGKRDNIIYNKWNPFYIGKSEKLSDRINQHCFEKNKICKTSSLKLKHRVDLINNAKFRVTYFQLENDMKANKHILQFIITNLENELRQKLNPWIGKK